MQIAADDKEPRSPLRRDQSVVTKFPTHADSNASQTMSKERLETHAVQRSREWTAVPDHWAQRVSSQDEEMFPGNSATHRKKFVTLRNLLDETTTVDVLHLKRVKNGTCTAERCTGSLMGTAVKSRSPRSEEELLVHAQDFIDQYYSSTKRQNTTAHNHRWQEVRKSIEETGTYNLTASELSFGTKTSWRNASRCIGRIQWNRLQVFDARHTTSARGMFEALCNHIQYATNNGILRSAITIFPQRLKGRGDYRVWNSQLIMYAGYRRPDGSIIGDPKHVEFTEMVMKMGWQPKGSMFDILPLVLSAAGQDPEFFEIPKNIILEVNLEHPTYSWFGEMGLKWYAVPAVSNMLLDCGGLEFTACPFNGWYMCTEVGARDLCDVSRYNILEKVASQMGLNTRNITSLWKDRALVEVNIAVLHSYQSRGVTIMDHHSAAESFMKHLANEQRLRGGCPSDWVWIVPPISGSITPVFHQEMLNYALKPSFEYQEDPWKTQAWRNKCNTSSLQRKRKFGFKVVGRAVIFVTSLMGRSLARRTKCIILFATETGKSEQFARMLCDVFIHAFDAKVICMDSYDVSNLEQESLVLIVTSTFGNGDPPENGVVLAKTLYEMKHRETNGSANLSASSRLQMSMSSESTTGKRQKDNQPDENFPLGSGPLTNIRYSVFALGSRTYSHFAAFGHFMHKIMGELGALCIHPTGEGDELNGQETSFKQWAGDVFQAACTTFCLENTVDMNQATEALHKDDHSWAPGRFRICTVSDVKEVDVCQALTQLHGKAVIPCKLKDRIQLQAQHSTRQTILAKLSTDQRFKLHYAPGDHIAIFPQNRVELVDAILARLHEVPSRDQIVKVEIFQGVSSVLDHSKNWIPFEKIPACSLRTALTQYFDVTTPPTQTFLNLLATLASSDTDKRYLNLLATDTRAFVEWRSAFAPNLLEVLEQFPSVKVTPSLLLTQLPLLKPRWYSISSSPQEQTEEIHITLAVLKYRTRNGIGITREGVCSGWLNHCDIGSTIPCATRVAHNFHLPEDQTLPVIMIGPGTGIAPFRSFWRQRKLDMESKPVPSYGERQGWGGMYLFFGCRQAGIDDLYSDELLQMKKDRVLTEVFVALSRQEGKPKTYVQDLLLMNAPITYEAIVKLSGHFYVCGDASMASEVTKILEYILCQYGDMSPTQAETYIRNMKDNNRFHEDIYGVNLNRQSEGGDVSRDARENIYASF